MSFIAKFGGDCENCEIPISQGDRAKMVDYDKGLIAHVTCPTPKSKPREVVCSRCFLIHAGDCY